MTAGVTQNTIANLQGFSGMGQQLCCSTGRLSQDIDTYMNQLQQGQMPQQPVQVPGANQGQAALASQLMQGGGQLFTRSAPGQPMQPAA